MKDLWKGIDKAFTSRIVDKDTNLKPVPQTFTNQNAAVRFETKLKDSLGIFQQNEQTGKQSVFPN